MKTAREQLLEKAIFAFLEQETKERWRQLGGLNKQRNPKHGFPGAWKNQPHRPGIGEKAQLREGGNGFGFLWKQELIGKGQRRCQGWHFFFLLLFLDWLSCWEQEGESGKEGLSRGLRDGSSALKRSGNCPSLSKLADPAAGLPGPNEFHHHSRPLLSSLHTTWVNPTHSCHPGRGSFCRQ